MPNPNGRNGSGAAAPLSRSQILDATEQCLSRRGYDATTIRLIAQHLGCAVGSIYRHFRDKRDLLYAVCQRMLATVADLAEAGATIERCEQAYHDRVHESPHLYPLMFWLASAMQQRTSAPGGSLPRVVERIIDAWSTQLDGDEAARCRWATLHGDIVAGLRHRSGGTGSPGAASDDGARHRALLSSLTPLPPLPGRVPPASGAVLTPGPGPDGADPADAREQQEDVCLL